MNTMRNYIGAAMRKQLSLQQKVWRKLEKHTGLVTFGALDYNCYQAKNSWLDWMQGTPWFSEVNYKRSDKIVQDLEYAVACDFATLGCKLQKVGKKVEKMGEKLEDKAISEIRYLNTKEWA